MKRGRGFAVSAAQRKKATDEGACRVCKKPEADPAHIIPRSLGGCNDPDCVIPLCRHHHRRYDRHEHPWLDVLSVLTVDEQAHAVSHLRIMGALERVTNRGWLPEVA